MQPFELAEPASLGDALALLDASARPISGGTAVMLMMKAGVFRPQRLVSLRRLAPALSGVAIEASGAARIGAMTPLAALERAPQLAAWPILRQTLRTLSNVRVRNVATLGGHLAHADPHMDLPPVLAALAATVTIAGRQGERTIAVEQLATGYLETSLAPDELITAVTIPPLGARQASYLKWTTRTADDWPSLGIAVSIARAGDTLRDARLFVGAATDRPTRVSAAEQALAGARVDAATLARAGEAAAASVAVIADQHGSADYKRQLVRVLLPRAIRAALGESQ